MPVEIEAAACPQLTICHLYPDLMNLYGDRGNLLALERRCDWHGIGVRTERVGVGQPINQDQYDLFVIGGGQDREQQAIARDLREEKGHVLVAAVEAGAALLAVCGGYQLLGRWYRPVQGETIEGVGLFDLWTEGSDRRLIGNAVADSNLDPSGSRTLVGFENHSGRTFLGPGIRPLGRVVVGHGNNAEDKSEGAVYRHAVGTYLHGSLLPKNPWLADWLITRALERRYGTIRMTPLDDSLENRAHAAAIRRATS